MLIEGALSPNGSAALRGDLRNPEMQPLPRHLGRHEPPPYQLIKGEQVLIEMGFQFLGCKFHVRRPDPLMGVLGRLAVAENIRLSRDIGRPECCVDELSRLTHRLIRDAHRIGSHVGNETCRGILADLHTLKEFLGHEHGLFWRELEPARRILLEGARFEGRIGARKPLLLLDPGDDERRAFQGRPDLFRLLFCSYARLCTVNLFELGFYLLPA